MQLLFSTGYFIIFLLKHVYKTKTVPECLKEFNNWSCLAAIVLDQKNMYVCGYATVLTKMYCPYNYFFTRICKKLLGIFRKLHAVWVQQLLILRFE